MLYQTFLHLTGVGHVTEQNLWKKGIANWNDWQDPPPVPLPNSSRIEALRTLELSLDAMERVDATFFTSRLPVYEHWRLFPHFRKTLAYLDIETTGGQMGAAEITAIALYDGQEIYTYVNGQNLEDFLDDIQRYSVLVTYNGKCFDIPFIENYFRTTLPHAQIDLRYVLSKMGYKGGLKGCEKQLGIHRFELDGVDGYMAVLLWNEYVNSGDEEVLDTLLAYNIADTVNLEQLMIKAYNLNLAKTPFEEQLQIDLTPQPVSPYFAHNSIVDDIRRKYCLGSSSF